LRLNEFATSRVLMVTFMVRASFRLATLSNRWVRQTSLVESETWARHLVFCVFENSISIVLSVRYLGKFVPVIVKLSKPKTLRSVAGAMEVIEQSTWILATSDLTGMRPIIEKTSGLHLPHTGSSFKVHSIFVADWVDSSTIHSTCPNNIFLRVETSERALCGGGDSRILLPGHLIVLSRPQL